MLGSLACHYITQQIRLKNSFPYSLHLPTHSIQWSLCHKYTQDFFLFTMHTFGYSDVISSLSPPLPLIRRYILQQGDTSRPVGGPLGLHSVACGQMPDTCEPWQSYQFTVAVRRLLCQTKHQHNIVPFTAPQQFPPAKWLRPTFLLHSRLFLQSYATVNTASEIVFVSPCQRLLIISECQGCLLGPPHFSPSQTHFLCCVTSSPIVKAYS